MQSRSGKTKYKVKTIGRLKDRKSGKVIKSFKESGGGTKSLFGKKVGGEMQFPKTKGSYKIKSGDTLSGIAKARGTTVSKIMKMNPSIKDKNKIRAGAGLKLPPKPIKATAKDKQKAARGMSDIKKIFSPTQRQQLKRAILKKQAAAQNQMAKKRAGGVMKAMGGKMAKGYSKGGARRMMTAMGGKMAKGYSKGGARMNLSTLRRAAGGMGYKLTKK